METTDQRSAPALHRQYVEGEKLGAEISELCSYIYAASYRLLVLIREFDEQGYWEFPVSAPVPTGSTSSEASA